MILIIGGVYQGKLEYSLNRFGLNKEDVYFCDMKDITIPTNKKIIYELEKWIFALVSSGCNVAEKITNLIEQNLSTIIICNDISCGVVPIDKELRIWREEVGRATGTIAQNSTEVVRLYCKIPTRIKYTQTTSK